MMVNSSIDITTVAMVGGHPALDLANTLSGRRDDDVIDRLRDFGDVVTWARRAGLLDEAAVRDWRQQAEDRPAKAETNLQRVRDLRELIYRVFAAIADRRDPAAEDLRALEASWRSSAVARELVWLSDRAGWRWTGRGDGLSQIIGPIVASAVELLGSDVLARVRQCRADDCQWLFLDTSRNRSRRWCDMADCGNRAKARRHYRKARESG